MASFTVRLVFNLSLLAAALSNETTKLTVASSVVVATTTTTTKYCSYTAKDNGHQLEYAR